MLTLAALVMLAVQVAGSVRGYLCDCTGRSALVAAEHCHGPHGAWCHRQSDAAASRDSDSDTDTEQHAAVGVELKAKALGHQSTGLGAPALTAMLPALTWPAEIFGGALRARRAAKREVSPPSAAVVRSIQLVI